MELKETLLMPKTNFPMRGNLPVKELDIHKYWSEIDIYQKLLEERKDAKPFILHDGPPYANGSLHMGHALNKIMKDIVNRYQLMLGKYINYVPGWDTHGLPIEQKVTSNGVNRKEKTIAEFRTICKEYALEQVEIQKEQFKRLGIYTNWDEIYLTLMPEFEAEQLRVFGKMLANGLIYKGYKTVYWSPSSESALAEAEVEYADITSPSLYVPFSVVDGNNVLDNDTEIVIWTTTPWTLPANLAITLNKEFTYAVVKVDARKFVVAKELLATLAEKFSWTDYEIVSEHLGADLNGITTKHPLFDRTSIVVLGEHVTLDAGTGAVHTAPGYGEDDFEMGKQYDLGMLSITNERGIFTEDAGKYAGMFYLKANDAIIEDLTNSAKLLKQEDILHAYPHDWRTKKPIIYWVTNQWFASVDKIRDNLLNVIENEVQWYIPWASTRLGNMMKSRNDWCISRQRVWGVPIPIFYTEAGNPIMDEKLVNHVADLFAEHGSNIWFEKTAIELLPEGFTHPESPNGLFTKEEDIMDVWFDSGTSHAYITKKYGFDHGIDMYLEGSDQYRGWFNSSIITGVATTGHSPYKSVVSAGFALDGNGRKMSKSLGNTVDPLKLIKQFGADIIRLWVASVDYTADVRISNEIMKQLSESYRKIRNNFRFMLGNLHDFDANDKLSYDELADVDKYILTLYQDYINSVNAAYEKYAFIDVYKESLQFITNTLSAFYLDYAKDSLYCDAKTSLRRRQIQTVIFEILTGMVKVLTPILPHTTEEVWQEMKTIMNATDKDSILETIMPSSIELTATQITLKNDWDQFMILRDDVLKALEEQRNAGKVGKSLDAQLLLAVKPEYAKVAIKNEQELNKLFIVSKAVLKVYEAGSDYNEAIEFDTAFILADSYDAPVCPRCWNRFDLAELNDAGLCPRCAEIVASFE